MEELIHNLDFEEINYYYHITSKGFGMDIINNGLYLEENDLRSTTIKLSKEFLENPERYCKLEYVNGSVKRQEMVLIGCSKYDEKYLIRNTDIPIYLNGNKMNYLIRSENILGYIDLETLNFIYNVEYIFDYKEAIKCLKV